MAAIVSLLRILLVIQLLFALAYAFDSAASFNSIHKRMRTASPTSQIYWDKSWTAVEDTLKVFAQPQATYFWALYISPLGYCGLQFNLEGTGPSLHFTLWDITTAPKGAPECVPTVDVEGTFVKCHYSNFKWEMNRTYRRRIEHIGNNYYTCSITDTTTGAKFTTAAMQTGYVGKNDNAFQFFEYPQEIGGCTDQLYGRVTYTIPVPTPAANMLLNNIVTATEPCPNICWSTSPVASTTGSYAITCGTEPDSKPTSSLLLYHSHAPVLLTTVTFSGGVSNPVRIPYGTSAVARAVHGFARVTSAAGGGFITIWPSGDAAKSSTLNYVPGETPTSTFTIALADAPSANAYFMAYSHVVATVEFYSDGYFSDGIGLFLHPLRRPLRLLETRTSECHLADGSVVPDCRASSGSSSSNAALVGVPPRAQAVSLTAALITSGAGASVRFGTTTVDAAQTSAPPPGTAVAVVEISAVVRGDGSGVSWNLPWTLTGPVACAVDIDGYYDPNPAGGLGLELLATPLRWVDTRPPEPSFPAIYSGEGALQDGNDVRTWKICDKEGEVLVATVTTVGAPAYTQGFVTIWPTGAAAPVVSQAQNRGVKDQGTALGIHITCGVGGFVSFRANVPTHLIVDVTAVYRPYPASGFTAASMAMARVYHDHRMNFPGEIAIAGQHKAAEEKAAARCVSSDTPKEVQSDALERLNFWRAAAGQQPATLKASCADLQAAAVALSNVAAVSHNLSANECFSANASASLRYTAIAIVTKSATGADAIDKMMWSHERVALLIPEASEFGFACAESEVRRVCVARATARSNPFQSYIIFPRNMIALNNLPQNALWSFASPAMRSSVNISLQVSLNGHNLPLLVTRSKDSKTVFWSIREDFPLVVGEYHVTISGVGTRKSYTVQVVASAAQKAEAGAVPSKRTSGAIVAVIVVASAAAAVALLTVLVIVWMRKRAQQKQQAAFAPFLLIS